MPNDNDNEWKNLYTVQEFIHNVLTSSEADIALARDLHKLGKWYNSVNYVYKKADSKTKARITRAYMR